MKHKVGDLVFVKPPMPGLSEGGTGMVVSISTGEEGTNYLVDFGGESSDWYHESLVTPHKGKIIIPKYRPKKSQWDHNPQLRELVLDAWFELSPEVFHEAYEICHAYGSAMLDWLEVTNPELYKNARVKGAAKMGIKTYFPGDEDYPELG